MTAGMSADIYRHRGYDSTNGGVSGKAWRVVVIHPELPEMYEPGDDMPGLNIIEHPAVPGYLIAVPLDKPEGMVGPMFGGNFVYSMDGRFRAVSKYPVPVHDRFETSEQYAMLSS